jgi:cation diffusion facilitator family transporter
MGALGADADRRPAELSTRALGTATIANVSSLDDPAASDRRLLMLSVWASVGFAVLSSVWGVLSGSSMIVFDGLYSFVSVGLSLLAVMALRTVRRGPDASYPWGREVWEPLVVVVKALALAALCVYAVIGGVSDLLAGGRDVATGWALVYAVVSTVGGVVVTLLLRRGAASDLVRAEAAEWFGDTLLSVGVLVGFAAAFALVATGHGGIAAYVDPAMVVVVSMAFLHVPIRLVAGGLREILTMAPPAPVRAELQACVDAVAEQFGLQESFLRASKVGGRVDVEVDFVVGGDSAVRTVVDCDVVRQALHDRLATLGYERSMVVAFTTDRKWAQ